MSMLVAFVICMALAFGGAALWHFWQGYARIKPEEDDLDREMTNLNDYQANKLSDEQLRRPIDPDTAWQIMVQRGSSAPRRQSSTARRASPSGRLPSLSAPPELTATPPRRERRRP